MDRATIKTILIALKTKTPVILWGNPGIGKTATIMQIGEATGSHVEVYIASLRDITDAAGFPYVDRDGIMKQSVPSWLKKVIEKSHKRPVIFFCDELTCADPGQQSFLLRVCQERVVGEICLPENVGIIAAANPADIAAGGSELSTPLANRFMHIHIKPDFTSWENYMRKKYCGEKDRNQNTINKILQEIEKPSASAEQVFGVVLQFLKKKREHWNNMPKDESSREGAWPSQRTWDKLVECMQYAWGDTEVEGLVCSGLVGFAAANEFLQFKKEFDLQDPKYILDNVDSWVIPDRDRLYASMSAVVSYVAEKTKIVKKPGKKSKKKMKEAEKIVEQFWQLIIKLVNNDRRDIAVKYIREISRNEANEHVLEFDMPQECYDIFINLVAGGANNESDN